VSRIRYSFVIPVFNEQETLPELHRRLSDVIKGLDGEAELLFVDDCSYDGSFELLAELGRRDERIRVIRFARNFGHQVAITAGLEHAVGDAVVVLDADLQDPPEVVPDLVARWKEGYEVVYAVREHRSGESWVKRVTASWFYRILRRIAHIEIPLDAGDFRLVDRRAVDAFRAMRERTRYVRGMFSWVGFRQSGVLYTSPARTAGQSKYSGARMFRLAADAVIGFSNRPLRLGLNIGFAVSIASILFGLSAVITKLAGYFVVPGWTSVMILVGIVGGIQLVVLGVIGEYVSHIFDEVKRRPLYVVSRVHGVPEQDLRPWR
jgi:polyisoprenyl-phosphate glycosyltransferase